MKRNILRLLLVAMAFTLSARAASLTLTNPVLFVTQVQMPKEFNGGTVTSTVLSTVSFFGNHRPDPEHAGRGGDLWLMTTNLGLVNLTRKAGLGTNGSQDGIGIAVRDPAIHWSGTKAIFSMVVGAPTSTNDPTPFFWQMYEITNLAAVIADTNVTPGITLVSNQPANYNNINPTYGTDGRIIFTTDRPLHGDTNLFPQLEEYKSQPTVTGIWSLDPATGNLRMLNHTPSGAFHPFVDSFGRVIFTRWDHLVQDSHATDDRLGRATNGAFNFTSEASSATNALVAENFPEPRNFDSNGVAALGVNGNAFNFFFPWQMPEGGGNEELLNHVGRHELQQAIKISFTNDPNLFNFTNANRVAAGIATANTNYLENMFGIVEDPRVPGTYFGVDSPDFAANGGFHASGQLLKLTGGPPVNPTNMIITYLTPKSTAGANAVGVYRDPLPMSDGTLLAAFTTATNHDINCGTDFAPNALFKYRLAVLATNAGSGGFYVTNGLLTSGLTNTVSYWTPAGRVTQTNALWELQPVEVRARTNPGTSGNGNVAGIEAAVFAAENVDLPTFQADLAARGLALVISRNVTARDAADKQQPYNLRVPGGTAQTTITNTPVGKIYDITHLQYMQADLLRGYTQNTPAVAPGRRVLATPLHDTTAFNLPSGRTNAPAGGIELMSDGSQATIVPAGRALTWQLTGATNEAVVRERYWITFRPGEVRTCANCHGINAKDQAGNPPPSNPPQALQNLLRFWRTNAANAYALTVSNGTGGGAWGAGSLLTLTAGAPPTGKMFLQWSGPGVANSNSATTLFTMPGSNTTVTAVFTNLPTPNITGWQFQTASNNYLFNAQAVTNSAWILETSYDLLSWSNLSTNPPAINGLLQLAVPFTPGAPRQFYRLKSP